ncbi:MAG: hypothetical protein KC983_03005 [Phycisphaerales bacterium]|nr:hypothetical protein [Phycisphaerales bacterium]
MNIDGQNMTTVFRQARDLCSEMGLLLTTAESQMSEGGWVASSRAAAAGGSQSLDQPRKWIPEYVHRYFTNPQHPHLLAFIAIVIEHGARDAVLPEPLLVFGWFECKDTVDETTWWYEMCLAHFRAGDRTTDGDLLALPTSAVGSPKLQERLASAVTAAIPLVEIQTTEALAERVTVPLDLGLQSVTS